jgi:hypothetical protein
MPPYGDLPAGVGTTLAGPTAIVPGDSLALFNNETIAAAPQASIVAARAAAAMDGGQGVSFFIEFAAAPTDSLQILGTNKTPAAVFTLADWVTLYTSTNKQQDSYTDLQPLAYYCAYLASQSGGGKVTVIAQR